jgi:hypothetical protein
MVSALQAVVEYLVRLHEYAREHGARRIFRWASWSQISE